MFARENYTLSEYQTSTATTAVYPGRGELAGLAYLGLGLCGESGEVAEKLKKIIRDNGGEISPEKRELLAKELGDVMWYVGELCTHLGIKMADVALGNICKLRDRADRGVLGGSGDIR